MEIKEFRNRSKPQNIKRSNKLKSGWESKSFILRRKFRKMRIVLRRRIEVLVIEFILRVPVTMYGIVMVKFVKL